MPSSRRLLALATLVTLPLAGCVAGSATVTSNMTPATQGEAASSAAASVTKAPATLAGRAGASASPSLSGEGVPGAELATALTAAINDRSSVRLDLAGAAGTGTMLVDTKAQAAKLTLKIPSGRTYVLVRKDSATWIKGVSKDPAKPWTALAADGSDPVSKQLGGSAVFPPLNLTKFTGLFAGLLGDKTPSGDGSQVRFEVPAATYFQVMGGPSELRSAVTKPIDVVLKTDADGLPTSLVSTMVVKASPVVDTTTYSGWGKPVDVQAPGAALVAP